VSTNHHDDDAARAARIRARIKELGWPVQRVADAVGVPKSTVESWIYRRQVKPNWPHLAKLADVLDVTPGWLESGDQSAVPTDPVDMLRHDVDQFRGRLAHLDEQIRFIAANTQRITKLEEALADGRRELAEVREILEQQALDLMPVVTRLLQVEADRRSSEVRPPAAGERRASTGRRQNDPPLR